MQSERRNDPRTEAKGLNAKISLYQSNGSILIADATLLNVSRSGIKLRMKKPLIADVNTKTQLEVVLPDSKIPVIVNAVVVHSQHDSEFGMHYIDVQPEDPLEQLISECAKATAAA
ncbi:MAG: PilZ domain-containing protein [Gammaproteobacteria bacterium]